MSDMVLVDRNRFERLQDAARSWQQRWGQMWEGRRDVMHEAGLEWGDLDPLPAAVLSAEDREALARDLCETHGSDRGGSCRHSSITITYWLGMADRLLARGWVIARRGGAAEERG